MLMIGKNSEEGNLLTLKTSAKMVANKIMVTKTLQKQHANK